MTKVNIVPVDTARIGPTRVKSVTEHAASIYSVRMTEETKLKRLSELYGNDLIRLWTSNEREAVAWRQEQADVDADIEGIGRDPAVEAFMREMDEAGIGTAEQIERLVAYFRQEPLAD